MGNYNPHLPVILGQEWVPIRDEDLTFDESVNSFEQGTGFTLATARQVSTGRFYVNERPKGITTNQAYTMTVYASGQEDSAGPVRRVVIPVNSGATTGAGVVIFSPDTTVAQALSNPATSVSRGISFNAGNGNANDVNINFAVNDYAQLLSDKRILGVNLLYQFRRTSTTLTIPLDDPDFYGIQFFLTNAQTVFGGWTDQWTFPRLVGGTEADPPIFSNHFVRRRVGDVALFYDNSPSTVSNVIPWTYAELQKFEATHATPSYVHLQSFAYAEQGPRVFINYMAMEVFYCNENRTLFGTKIFNSAPIGSSAPTWGLGLNTIQLHPVSNTALSNAVLPAGDYVVTVNQASMGDNDDAIANFGPHAELNAIREIYPMEDQPGYRVLIPFPLDETAIDRELEVEETVVLPQLSLHTSGAGTALTEVHPYGRQVAAEVYGTVNAVQELLDTPVGGSVEYPWVRFYARRWGDTTVPLTLTGQAGLAGSSVTLTPDEWDALPETLDRWKEVSLQFDTPPTMGSLGTPSWAFTATGELAGNRWEVLGASAPAISGIPGNLLNLAPAAQQLYTATYSAPTGDVQDLEWNPQGIGSPYVSGSGTADDSSDVFLIFGQMPPTVSGFGVSILSQAVSGIGQQCEVDPCCIPTEIFYLKLDWDSLADELQEDDFGYYEIQRSDTEDSDWQTIFQGTSLSGSAFNDFEARVGIETSYRIRAVDLYGFWGEWSDEVSATIPAPGITIGCEGGHILILTSNERPCGDINLAYSSVWYRQNVEENFTFPEASFVQLQPMYDRNYFTAFRPTERGGEQFTRTVLVQAAAIPPETLADFRSLRDMAWEDVNYICVRDEDGNRWFATIGVPSGRVLNNRKLYLAPVQVVEVTDTPTPVDVDYCLPPEPEPDFTCEEVVAEDSFSRTEVGQWGTADLGGTWTEDE